MHEVSVVVRDGPLESARSPSLSLTWLTATHDEAYHTTLRRGRNNHGSYPVGYSRDIRLH